MAILIKTIMSGLIAASALAVVGTSASVALTPKTVEDLGVRQALTPYGQALTPYGTQRFDNSQNIHRAAWSAKEQRTFWERQQDRGG